MIDFPDVNAQVRCNCGSTVFHIGIENRGYNNFLRCFECVSCGYKLAVPYRTEATPSDTLHQEVRQWM